MKRGIFRRVQNIRIRIVRKQKLNSSCTVAKNSTIKRHFALVVSLIDVAAWIYQQPRNVGKSVTRKIYVEWYFIVFQIIRETGVPTPTNQTVNHTFSLRSTRGNWAEDYKACVTKRERSSDVGKYISDYSFRRPRDSNYWRERENNHPNGSGHILKNRMRTD